MSLEQVVYVGLNGRVAALNKSTGESLWEWRCPKPRHGVVMLLLEPDCLVASVNGYLYGLDPYTGDQLWHNPLKGWGLGITSLCSANNPQGNQAQAAAAKKAADDAAAAAAAAGS